MRFAVLVAVCTCIAVPAVAADEVTILRGTPAPPTPWYEPPPPPEPQPVVVYQPIVYPQLFYVLPVRQQHHHFRTMGAESGRKW